MEQLFSQRENGEVSFLFFFVQVPRWADGTEMSLARFSARASRGTPVRTVSARSS